MLAKTNMGLEQFGFGLPRMIANKKPATLYKSLEKFFSFNFD